MIGEHRLNNIREVMMDCLRNNIPGDFMETGAWRGGATMWMRAVLKDQGVEDRDVWVADTFDGWVCG